MTESIKGPTHVDRLNTLEKLAAEGYQGTDESLYTSLFEYHLAWREEGEDYIFIYAVHGKERFDRCSLRKDLDVRQEWDWACTADFFRWLGTDVDEWNALPLPNKVFDLQLFYGYEEIFGTCYWEGFAITSEAD